MNWDVSDLRNRRVVRYVSAYATAILGALGCGAAAVPEAGGTSSGGGTSAEVSSTSAGTTAADDSTTSTTTASTSTSTASTTSASTGTTGGSESTEASTTEVIPAICGDGISVPGELCFGESQYISDTRSHELALADLNDDGILDLLTSRDHSFAILLGQGDGTFVQLDAVPTTEPVRHFLCHDFDGDGTVDLATSHGDDDTVRIHPGVGDGLFGPHTEPWTFGNTNPRGLAAGDFDGDGSVDIAVALLNVPSLGILHGNGDGTFESERVMGEGEAFGLAAADLDGRGPVDLALGGFRLRTFRGSADGLMFDQSYSMLGNIVLAADFDEDGRADIATVGRSSDNVDVLRSTGDGSLELGFSGVLGDLIYDANYGDFDRDGRPDIVVTLYFEDEVAVLRSDAPGAVSLALGPRVSTVEEPRTVAVGDVNGDGVDDIVVGSNSSETENTGIAVILSEP